MKPYVFTSILDNTLKYKGYITFEGDDRVVFHGEGDSHTESLTYRFYNPLAKSKVHTGIWLSFDHDRQIAAGASIFSRHDLSKDEVLERMKQIQLAELNSMQIPLLRNIA